MGYFETVWRAVLQVPRGKVATYGGIATAAGHPGTARQVAWALRGGGPPAMPWHRVVGSGGWILLRGDAGERQRRLLEAEGVTFVGGRVDLGRHAHLWRLKGRRSRKDSAHGMPAE